MSLDENSRDLEYFKDILVGMYYSDAEVFCSSLNYNLVRYPVLTLDYDCKRIQVDAIMSFKDAEKIVRVIRIG